MKPIAISAALLAAALALAACAPEVGDIRWCKMMDRKDKADWTLGETGNYARYCVGRY